MPHPPRVGRVRCGAGLLVSVWLAALASGPAAADTTRVYVIEPARSQIRFHATSRFMDADGTFGRFTGEVRLDPDNPETASGRLTVEVASLDTGITMRDNHLRNEDFFDAARHPTATFVSSSVRRDGGRLLVDGQLTIRGVTQPLTVPLTAAPAGTGLRILGEFVLNRRAFGVSYNSRLNPIRDDVRVVVDLTAIPR